MTSLGWIVLVGICVGLAAALSMRLLRALRPSLPPARQHQLLSSLLVLAIVTPAVLPFVDIPSLTRALPDPMRIVVEPTVGAGSSLTGTATVFTPATRGSSLIDSVSAMLRDLAVLWSITVIAMLVRLGGGLWDTARLRSDARPANQDLVNRVERLATRAVTKAPAVLTSRRLDVPVTMGLWRPAIVVPERLLPNLSSRELDLVLSHELAHVRRADYASAVAHAALVAIAPLSPGHWQLVGLARRVREEACDDLAIGIAGDAGEFGAMLGRLAGFASSSPHGFACSAAWNVADRIKRLSPSFVPPRVGPARIALTVAMLLLSMAMTSEGILLAREATQSPVQSPEQSAGDLEAQHFLAKRGIFGGYAFHQSNSPVRLDRVSPARSYVYDTVVIRNVFAKQITAVMFNAIIERADAAVAIVSSPSLRLALEPGQRTELATHFLSLDEVSRFKLNDKVQPLLTVARVEFEDGTQWSAPFDISARSANAAMGIQVVTLPREFLSSALPANVSTPETNCYGGYSEDEQFSPGAIVPIEGEMGKFARCIDGRWVEVNPLAMTPEHSREDMRTNGVVPHDPAKPQPR
jgi:beta-lactamase regulating signal transducer with metallopeptidase domain